MSDYKEIGAVAALAMFTVTKAFELLQSYNKGKDTNSIEAIIKAELSTIESKIEDLSREIIELRQKHHINNNALQAIIAKVELIIDGKIK